MEKKLLTEDEIKSLRGLNDEYQDIQNKLGEIEIQLLILNHNKKEIEKELIDHKNNEYLLSQELQTKYGEGSVSLETGEFLPS